MPNYPDHYQSETVLRDGSTLRLRAIRCDDAARLLDLYHRLSRRTLYHRFFTIPQPDPAHAAYLADVDYDNHFALVGEIEDQIVAVARFYRSPDLSSRAEAAFTVADRWQAKGIGPLLLDRLASIAWERKITSFEAQVLTDNDQMMKVLSRSRFALRQKVESGVSHLFLSLAP